MSNEIGGRLAGNARWLGTRLDALLERAGVQAGADQVVGRSVDGYECGFPVSVAMDGRDAMVAVAMNGEPLPIEHGFPARLIVPGLYGYVSATKWLTEIELTTFADFDHYWLERGWAREAPIKLMSRIDTPKGLAKVAAGTVPIAGVAWAQHTGISGVEVRVDDGDWQTAQLADAPSADTWVQWIVAVGGDVRPPLGDGPGHRRQRCNPDRRACRTHPRRSLRPPPDRRDRRVTPRHVNP